MHIKNNTTMVKQTLIANVYNFKINEVYFFGMYYLFFLVYNINEKKISQHLLLFEFEISEQTKRRRKTFSFKKPYIGKSD